jgi:catechol 2,3-dioxygenase-like lactoylglutathione lyase family enzyme
MTAQLDHIVLNVANVDRALNFYVTVLGLSPERVDLYRAGKVLFPSVRINEHSLIDLMPPEMRTPQAASAGDGNSDPNLDHFCLSLAGDRWRDIVASLVGHGIEIEAGPMTLWGAHGDATALYIRDPDGTRVELRTYED